MYRTKRSSSARPRRRARGGAFESHELTRQNTQMVRVVTNDGESFSMPIRAASMSNILANMIGEDPEEEIPLPNVDARTMAVVVEFCTHALADPPTSLPTPLPGNRLEGLVQPWYVQFLAKFDSQQLAAVTRAANYLDIPSLLELCCAKIATFLRARTPDEVREAFGIQLDMSPEQQDALRQQILASTV
jgi:S-phase kinase-associated protein 1